MSTSKSETPFDIEAWLSDAELPETTVRVNKYAHLVAQLADLEQAHAAARREDAADVRLSSKDGSAYPIAQEMERLREQMESGWLTIRLRGLTQSELARGQKAQGDKATIRYISMQSVEPKLTEAQVETLRDKIGVGQFTAIVEAAGRVAFGEVSSPDFSASVLATLSTGQSSKS